MINEMYGELVKIQSEFDRMKNMSCVPYGIKKLRSDYIFDEDKSVKWNREQVEKNNQKYQDEVAKLNREKNKARDAVNDKLYDCIQRYVGNNISRQKAEEIWLFVSKWHAQVNGPSIQMLVDVVEMLRVVMKTERRKNNG